MTLVLKAHLVVNCSKILKVHPLSKFWFQIVNLHPYIAGSLGAAFVDMLCESMATNSDANLALNDNGVVDHIGKTVQVDIRSTLG